MSGSLLQADDVAAMLGVGKDWIYAEVRAGRIPHLRLGRHVRFRVESIERWLSELECGNMNGNGKRGRTVATAARMAPGGKPDADQR